MVKFIPVAEGNAQGEEEEIPQLRNIYIIIPDASDLEPLLECYVDLEDHYVPFPSEHLAGKLVRLLGMPDTDDEYWDGRVPVQILNPFDFRYALAWITRRRAL